MHCIIFAVVLSLYSLYNCTECTAITCAGYAFFSSLLCYAPNLPIMLSDFPIMLCGFTYYAQILNKKMYFLSDKIH